MNMLKVGTLTQSKSGLKNVAKSGSNPMNTGLRAIHYANIRARQSGTVRGLVSRLTEHGLAVSSVAPSFHLAQVLFSDHWRKLARTVLVIPSFCLKLRLLNTLNNHLQTLTGCSFQRFKFAKNTIPPCSVGLRAVFGFRHLLRLGASGALAPELTGRGMAACMGGCHE